MSNKARLSTPTKSYQTRAHPKQLFTPSPPPAQTHESSLLKLELRQKLEGFLIHRREWDEVVLSRGLTYALKIVELEAEIEATFQHASFVQECEESEVTLVDGYAWKQWRKLADYRSRLDTVLVDMANVYERFQVLNDGLEKLVQTACRINGIKATFDIPVWTTWSLPRFCDHLLSLCVPFSTSLSLYNTLKDVISSKETTRQEKQAAISYWACQPLLPELAALKELLAVEVPDFLNPQYSTPRKAI
ncbi:hypothetical protein CROQUDRAFT_719053 [Cronartium quercuum f. sp. fusiforme G11]|uniref:Uncharacterized protein n=1 Tax=Cronartium quercuum f. sp. fusiforme G11 TaxID=708437 RepID=A0A9P6N7V9_9BASI|nr:hypothetical protein CROQUDRAFT_719053 [Cronartium quercuum f. sp. fusiforme G11]